MDTINALPFVILATAYLIARLTVAVRRKESWIVSNDPHTL